MRVIGKQEEQKISIIFSSPVYMIVSKINIVLWLLMQNMYSQNNFKNTVLFLNSLKL